MNSEIDQLRRSAEVVELPGNLAGPSARHAIVVLGVLFLAQVSGCASVRTRIAGGAVRGGHRTGTRDVFEVRDGLG